MSESPLKIDAAWISTQLRALWAANTHNVADVGQPWNAAGHADFECWQFVLTTPDGRKYDVVVAERD